MRSTGAVRYESGDRRCCVNLFSGKAGSTQLTSAQPKLSEIQGYLGVVRNGAVDKIAYFIEA
jgi:hypothetical protein